MRTLLSIGLLLLFPSLFTLTQMGVELRAERKIDNRFRVDGEDFDLAPQWKGHKISLTDDALPTDASAKVILPWGHKERLGRVTITIDGKDFSWPYDVPIRPESRGELNRYHHGIFMGRLLDKEKGQEEFLIVQLFNEHGEDRYRVLRIGESGNVQEEIFSHSQRTTPLEHIFFVRLVYPDAIGIYSSVLQVWPSIFYPIAYPAGTGLLGAVLTTIALWRIIKRRRAAQPHDL